MTGKLMRPAALALALWCGTAPVALFAQNSADPAAATPLVLDPAVEERLAARRNLTQALASIAANPSDLFALTQAGRAALTLGDPRTAIGFLARAEALNPRDPVIKAAMGAALAQMEDPVQAMRYFDAAIAAGGLERAYMSDRGLAYDLLGDQTRAQADYVVAAQTHPSDELTRRHAISLGISGQADQAVQMLGPLLRAQDRAAWRSRAMILAMNGRAEEARQIARATMPRALAEGLEPYFELMDRLTPGQLAAASHFGHFPSSDVVRAQPSRMAARTVLASAAPVAAPAAPTTRNRDRRAADGQRNNRRANNSRDASRSEGATRPAATPAPAPATAVSTRAATVPAISSAPPPPPAPPPAPVLVSNPVVQTLPVPAPTSVPAPAPSLTPTPGPAPTPVFGPAPSPATAPAIAATPTPAPAVTPAPAPTTRVAQVFGPVDVAPSQPSAASTPTPTPAPAATPVAAAAVPPSAPVAAGTGDVRLEGWSLADMVASIDVPEAERAASANALSLSELQAIAAAQRERQAAEAAAARQQAQAEAEARRRTEAEARRRAEAEAEARAAAERLRRHPARIWVQVATGADVNALGYDCRRLTRQYSASFEGQSCSSAVWNRTRRMVVGPFRNAAAARAWLSTYSSAGGDGFVWNSDAGEEVTPIGRSR